MERNERTTVRVTGGGRIVIPGEVRELLGIEVGTNLVLSVEGDQMKLMNAKAARQNARKRVRRYVAGGPSLSRELMAQRKAEARRE